MLHRDDNEVNNCHFENILAEMKHISAGLTVGTPLFPQEGLFWGKDVKA